MQLLWSEGAFIVGEPHPLGLPAAGPDSVLPRGSAAAQVWTVRDRLSLHTVVLEDCDAPKPSDDRQALSWFFPLPILSHYQLSE